MAYGLVGRCVTEQAAHKPHTAVERPYFYAARCCVGARRSSPFLPPRRVYSWWARRGCVCILTTVVIEHAGGRRATTTHCNMSWVYRADATPERPPDYFIRYLFIKPTCRASLATMVGWLKRCPFYDGCTRRIFWYMRTFVFVLRVRQASNVLACNSYTAVWHERFIVVVCIMCLPVT